MTTIKPKNNNDNQPPTRTTPRRTLSGLSLATVCVDSVFYVDEPFVNRKTSTSDLVSLVAAATLLYELYAMGAYIGGSTGLSQLAEGKDCISDGHLPQDVINRAQPLAYRLNQANLDLMHYHQNWVYEYRAYLEFCVMCEEYRHAVSHRTEVSAHREQANKDALAMETRSL